MIYVSFKYFRKALKHLFSHETFTAADKWQILITPSTSTKRPLQCISFRASSLCRDVERRIVPSSQMIIPLTSALPEADSRCNRLTVFVLNTDCVCAGHVVCLCWSRGVFVLVTLCVALRCVLWCVLSVFSQLDSVPAGGAVVSVARDDMCVCGGGGGG